MKGGNLKVRAKQLLKADRPEAQVMEELHADGREVHFGALMELRSTNNKPAREGFWIYKGRIVFGGTLIR